LHRYSSSNLRIALETNDDERKREKKREKERARERSREIGKKKKKEINR